MSKLLNIFGVGGHSRELINLIKDINKTTLLNKYKINKIVVSNQSETKDNVINEFDFKKSLIKNSKNYYGLLAIGSPKIREKIVESFKDYQFIYPSFIHPSVSLNSSIEMGTGVIITKNSTLTVNINLNNHVQLNTGCTICHDVKIGEYTIISPGAIVCGCVTIGRGCFIGAGATIKDGVTIADNTIIGAGSVVVKNIKKSGVYVGVPAAVRLK